MSRLKALAQSPRTFRGELDVEKMLALLVLGRKAATDTYYVHTGNLLWWLYYIESAEAARRQIYLWDAPGEDGLLGWSLLSLDWRTFDVFTHPGLRGTPAAQEMFAWAQNTLQRQVKSAGGVMIRTMWISERDETLIDMLQQQGFSASSQVMLLLERRLDGLVPDPRLPPGWQVRRVNGAAEAEPRAAASYGAFESKLPQARYLQRMLDFMRSLAYSRALDLAAVGPQGQHAAFCLAWSDPVNRVGYFEPVGAHPVFRGRGLAKTVLSVGLQALQADGMAVATVCVNESNLAGQALYHAAGFRLLHKLLTFQRAIHGYLDDEEAA